MHSLPGLAVGEFIWISTPRDYRYYSSSTWYTTYNSSRALSIATNAVTTMMIGYKFRRVLMNETHGSSGAYHEGILRESPYIHPGDARAEYTKEPSANNIDSLMESGLVFL